MTATKSGCGTTSSDEMKYEGDHGTDQQDVNEKSCDVKCKKTTGP
jgi:hypothetical protein